MLQAFPLLGSEPFIAVNGDIWTDFDFASLPREPQGVAHLVLVDNPPQHPRGDFVLRDDGAIAAGAGAADGAARLTFAGIGVYRPEFLSDWKKVIGDAPGAQENPPRFSITPLLRAAISNGQVTWQQHRGAWNDIGTPQRLRELGAKLL